MPNHCQHHTATTTTTNHSKIHSSPSAPHLQFYSHLTNAHTMAHNTNPKPSCSKPTNSPIFHLHQPSPTSYLKLSLFFATIIIIQTNGSWIKKLLWKFLLIFCNLFNDENCAVSVILNMIHPNACFHQFYKFFYLVASMTFSPFFMLLL